VIFTYAMKAAQVVGTLTLGWLALGAGSTLLGWSLLLAFGVAAALIADSSVGLLKAEEPQRVQS
jgi:hypothetical protein